VFLLGAQFTLTYVEQFTLTYVEQFTLTYVEQFTLTYVEIRRSPHPCYVRNRVRWLATLAGSANRPYIDIKAAIPGKFARSA
jgi:hypothetical protein